MKSIPIIMSGTYMAYKIDLGEGLFICATCGKKLPTHYWVKNSRYYNGGRWESRGAKANLVRHLKSHPKPGGHKEAP